MRILKDADGDLWEETRPDFWECRTEGGCMARSLASLRTVFGPVTIFEAPKAADVSIYRVSRECRSPKLVSRSGLASILGNRYSAYVTKIERASSPEWTDVTSEFLRP